MLRVSVPHVYYDIFSCVLLSSLLIPSFPTFCSLVSPLYIMRTSTWQIVSLHCHYDVSIIVHNYCLLCAARAISMWRLLCYNAQYGTHIFTQLSMRLLLLFVILCFGYTETTRAGGILTYHCENPLAPSLYHVNFIAFMTFLLLLLLSHDLFVQRAQS